MDAVAYGDCARSFELQPQPTKSCGDLRGWDIGFCEGSGKVPKGFYIGFRIEG